MLSDSLAAGGARLQCSYRERVAQLVKTRHRAPFRHEIRRFQQLAKDGVNFPVRKLLTSVGDEYMIATGLQPPSALQVLP